MIRYSAQFRTFSTIPSLRSYSKAAEKLGVSRSMAIKQIKDLEADLGLKLFNRTTRQLSLTESGETLQASATELLEDFDAVEQELRSRTRMPIRCNILPNIGYGDAFKIYPRPPRFACEGSARAA